MTEKSTRPRVRVTIVSLWSKIDGLEGILSHRDHNVTYSIVIPAGDTDEDTLEAAFMLTNLDTRPNAAHACSTTVGDLMLLNRQWWFVDRTGFIAITEAEARQVKELSSTETGRGWAYLRDQKLVTGETLL
jgi:hypothetical protein